MNHVPVSSSNIESVAFDGATNKLQVKMRHGKLYEFDQVPPATHQELMAAPSIGRYLHENLKPNFTHRAVSP